MIYDDSIKPILQEYIEGFNTTIMVYGVTGAGKTHTVFGAMGNEESNELGILAYSMGFLLAQPNYRYRMSYLEIYNESVKDLLGEGVNLTVMEDSKGKTRVPNLTRNEVRSVEDVFHLVGIGNQLRKMAKTNSNKFSSRSHAIIQISSYKITEKGYVKSKLSFVDLAGCERIIGAQTHGERLTEGSNINRSLLALGKVTSKLSLNKKGVFIPYRDSKLTRLLKDSLGGNARTVFITCITPKLSQLDETFHSLFFSLTAKSIQSSVRKNVEISSFGERKSSLSPSTHMKNEVESERIKVLEEQVGILKKALRIEKGGRGAIQNLFTELVNGMEEQYELKTSLREIEDLQKTNTRTLSVKLSELDEADPGTAKYISVESDIKNLREIIKENNSLRIDILKRMTVLDREREEWVMKSSKDISQSSNKRLRSQSIHKSKDTCNSSLSHLRKIVSRKDLVESLEDEPTSSTKKCVRILQQEFDETLHESADIIKTNKCSPLRSKVLKMVDDRLKNRSSEMPKEYKERKRELDYCSPSPHNLTQEKENSSPIFITFSSDKPHPASSTPLQDPLATPLSQAPSPSPSPGPAHLAHPSCSFSSSLYPIRPILSSPLSKKGALSKTNTIERTRSIRRLEQQTTQDRIKSHDSSENQSPESISAQSSRIATFKKQIKMVSLFLSKFEKKAMEKGAFEIYKVVKMLLDEDRARNFKVAPEDKYLIKKMKVFCKQFQNMWEVEDQEDIHFQIN